MTHDHVASKKGVLAAVAIAAILAVAAGMLAAPGLAWSAQAASGAAGRAGSVVRAQASAVESLTAAAKGATITVTWKPPQPPHQADSISVRLHTDALLGTGAGVPDIVHSTVPTAGGIQVAAPAGAYYLITVTTQGPGNSSADATTGVTSWAKASLRVSVPARVRVRRIIKVAGTVSVGAACFPVRGKVRAYRYWWNGRRWLLKGYADITLKPGSTIGSRSTFVYNYKPRLKGYWNFTLKPRYYLGFRSAKPFYYSKNVRVI